MSDVLANDFDEILPVLAQNEALRAAILSLISTAPIAEKVIEGGDRLDRFRQILRDLVSGQYSLSQASEAVGGAFPRQDSPHSDNNRVFAQDWEERLVKTQLSRFYNQTVMEQLMASGETECFVPHSHSEDSNSPCTRQLAGTNQDLQTLHTRLVQSYGEGNWSKEPKIPDHPYCTHVVTRIKR